MFVFQLHVFIIVVCEKISRDKKGKSPWVKAQKKPSHKSQRLKDFDEEWGKNLANTDKGSWNALSSLLALKQPSTISAYLGAVRVELDGTNKLSIALNFFWTKLCHAQEHDSFLQIIFCWESPGTLFLYCYWWSAFQVFQNDNLTCGKPKVWSVDKTLEVKKHTLYLH